MAIFGVIKCDDNVFTGDKIRFDVSESFVTPDETLATPISHEISVDGGVSWYNITAKKMVDWIFTSAGNKTITLRITALSGSQTFTKSVTVLDLTTAKLFSKDFDLYQHEPEIDQYLPKKWSSWNMIHKRAQDWIIDFLDEKGIFNENGAKYTVNDLHDLQQVKQLSTYKTLEFIFEGNSNVVGDIFSIKAAKYKELSNTKASRSQLSLDYNANGVNDDSQERTNLHTVVIKRR